MEAMSADLVARAGTSTPVALAISTKSSFDFDWRFARAGLLGFSAIIGPFSPRIRQKRSWRKKRELSLGRVPHIGEQARCERQGQCSRNLVPLHRRRLDYANSVSRAESDASTTVGMALLEIAMSGSLRPFPVNTHTTVEPFGTPYFKMPATEAAEAGSQKIDS